MKQVDPEDLEIAGACPLAATRSAETSHLSLGSLSSRIASIRARPFASSVIAARLTAISPRSSLRTDPISVRSSSLTDPISARRRRQQRRPMRSTRRSATSVSGGRSPVRPFGQASLAEVRLLLREAVPSPFRRVSQSLGSTSLRLMLCPLSALRKVPQGGSYGHSACRATGAKGGNHGEATCPAKRRSAVSTCPRTGR